MTTSAAPANTIRLPHSFREVILRGLRARCPRCGNEKLFYAWLKPKSRCSNCGLDLTPQRADDFPAYLSILVTGHILAPIIIALVSEFTLSAGQLLAIIIPLALIMILALIQPAKGAVIAAQWWNGMHGFRRERAVSADISEKL